MSIDLSILIDHLPEKIYWMDIEGKIINCNQKQLDLFGMTSRDELIGKDIFDVAKLLNWPHSLAAKIRKIDQAVVDHNESIMSEESVVDFHGEKKIILTHKHPWLLDGKPAGIIGIGVDVTQKKEAEQLAFEREAIDKTTQQLKLAVGAIAHDLRTPLASIKFALTAIDKLFDDLVVGYKKAVEMNLIKAKMRSGQLDMFRGALERCIREVDFSNRYIDLTLFNAGFSHLNTQCNDVFTMTETLNHAINNYPFPKEQSNLVDCDFSDDFSFWGNGDYLRNALNNLLRNSLYYILEARKGRIKIELATDDPKYNFIRYTDTAKGAPADVCSRMFDGYFSTRNNGTGLGLAFCKAMMITFNGYITAESVEGEYITFTLAFPKL